MIRRVESASPRPRGLLASLAVMAPTVIKLGSSITADERGDLRSDVLERICDEVAALDQAVVVTSGAIARGVRVLDLPVRPTAIADLQAASAVGQGKLFP